MSKIRFNLLVPAAALISVSASSAFAQTAPTGGAAASQPVAKYSPKTLGILVFPGVQVIDFAGPYEILTSASKSGFGRLFNVIVVGLTPEMITTGPGDKGLKLTPDSGIDTCPKLDILVIPGGEVGSLDDPKAKAFIAKSVKECECVMSVCNAAFALAKAGHLKNQSATTFYYFIDSLKKDDPTIKIVYDKRFVDNGKIITTAGLTSGIDGAMHLVERYSSRHDARQLALGLEYNWQPDSDYARANMADRHLIRMLGATGFDFPKGGVRSWTPVENDGTTSEWTKRWTFASDIGEADIRKILDSTMAKSWTKSANAEGSHWSFKDELGRPWSAVCKLTPTGDKTWTAWIHLAKS